MGKQKNFKQEKKVNFTQVCNFWRTLGKISVFLSFCVFSVFLTFSFFFFFVFFFCWGSFSYKDLSYKKNVYFFCLPVIITRVFSRLLLRRHLFVKVNNNRNTRIMCGICSRLTIRTNEINDDVLLSLYLTLNVFHTLSWGFFCWLVTSKCRVGMALYALLPHEKEVEHLVIARKGHKRNFFLLECWIWGFKKRLRDELSYNVVGWQKQPPEVFCKKRSSSCLQLY